MPGYNPVRFQCIFRIFVDSVSPKSRHDEMRAVSVMIEVDIMSVALHPRTKTVSGRG